MGQISLKAFNPDVIRAAGISERDVVGRVNAYMPITACKADPEVEGRMIVEGYASTSDKDFEGETTLQEGLQWQYHLKHGWLTDGHEKIDKAIAGLGHPLDVRRTTTPDGKPATYYRAFLLDTPANRRLYESIQAAVKLGDSRYGFSIQGPILRRDGPDNKQLAQVLITDVALTRHPVNPYATLTGVAKSLDALNNGQEWSQAMLRAFDVQRSAVDDLLDMAEKSLEAGHPVPNVETQSTGAALMKQSLRGGRTNMRKVKKADFAKLFGDMSTDEMKKMAVAKGMEIEIEDEDEDEGKDDDEDKGDEAEKALDGAMSEIMEHLKAGGRVILDNGTPEEAVDASGLMGKVVEAAKALQIGDEATSKGILAMMGQIKSLSDTVTGLRAEMAEARKSLDAFAGQPLQPRAVRAGAPMARPDDTPAVPNGALPLDVARKALTSAMRTERDVKKIDAMGSLLTGLEGRNLTVTAEQLKNLGVYVE